MNAAVELVESGTSVAEVARVLAARFGVSVRQGRRYADHAAAGRVVVPEATTVFTVKLPVSLAARIRALARETETPVSGLTASALTEFLQRGRRQHPRW